MNITRTILAAALMLGAAQVTGAQDKPAEDKDKAPASQPAAPIDYKKLKESLPETIAGLKRTEASGEKSGFGAMKISQAHASYAKDKEKPEAGTIELMIIDHGANKDVVQGIGQLLKFEIDKEGDEGFQKTLKIQEQPAMQQYTNEGKSGTLQILVSDRYYITINTTGLSADEFKKIGDELKLKDIAALK